MSAELHRVLRLREAAGLDLDENVDQRNRRRGHTGNAARLGQSARAHALQFFVHLAGEAADRGVIKPFGDGALLGLLQPLNGALLLLQLAGILDGGLDGFQFVADGRTDHHRGRGGIEEVRHQRLKNGHKSFDGDFGTL